MEGNCSPGTAAEAEQGRQAPAPGTWAAGHTLGTAEAAAVQSADCSLLKRQHIHLLLLVNIFHRISLTVMDKKI